MTSDQNLIDDVRDLATEHGTYILRMTTVGDYLARLGLYNPDSKKARFDPNVAANFQRTALDIRKNPIKQRMLRDLCRGGTLPPLVVYERPGQARALEIIDGLQRTHVQTEALHALITLERGEQPEDYAQVQFTAIREQGQKLLTADEFLRRPVVLQVWRNLQSDELVRLFMVLNAGQQKVSPRHLLEVIHADLRTMFEAWGIRSLTEKEEKTIPRPRERKPPEAIPIPSVTYFRYEFLVNGLIAYVSCDPQIKTRGVLEDEDSVNYRLSERVMEVGSEVCKADFQWVCLDLNKLINKKYAAVPKWRGIIQTSDNFFIPLMSAMGEARASARSGVIIEQRKSELLEVIGNSKDDDPLRFYTDGSNSLEKILDGVESNIGRRRDIVYFAWRSFFREGVYEANYPIDWPSINRNPIVASTRATIPTATPVSSLRAPLRMQLRDDHLRRMSPERRAIYERIRKLRDKIGSIDPDVIKALQELRENTQLSEDLARFCSRQGILPYLPIAIDLIEACFSSIQELHLQPEQDPETGEEWLVLDVTIQEDEEKALDAYNRYIDHWISAVPWPERNKTRLSYNII